MRIGLSTAAFYGRLETEDAAMKVASFGLPCCEVFFETYSEYTRAFGARVNASLGRTQAVSVHAKTQHFEGDIFGRSARQRADAFAMMEGFLDAGEAVGARIYVYHGPANMRGAAPDFVRWREAIERVIALCAARGMDFCWEVVSWCYLNSPARVTLFRELWPTLCFVLDVKQVYELKQDVHAYVDAMGPRLRHIHVLDYDAQGRYVLPGQGLFDFPGFARALNKSGYAGDVILEPYCDMVPNDEALARSLDWLRRVFDENRYVFPRDVVMRRAFSAKEEP